MHHQSWISNLRDHCRDQVDGRKVRAGVGVREEEDILSGNKNPTGNEEQRRLHEGTAIVSERGGSGAQQEV